MNYTPEQIAELVACLEWKNFSARFGGEHAAFEGLRTSATRWQVLKYFLWTACYNNDRTLTVVFPNYSMSKDFTQEFLDLYESLPKYLKPGLRYTNLKSIEFDNRSRCYAMHDPCHARGLTLSAIAIWEGISDDMMNQWEHTYYPSFYYCDPQPGMSRIVTFR